MESPAKPFACTAPDCGKTFTNEDHLTVHIKKHDMELQLGLGQKNTAFPADQTPTPTRFIRNCEEVGLFQDLQNVNPFDEGFKRAMEAKTGILLSLDNTASTGDDALHTPHIFPNLSDTSETSHFKTDPVAQTSTDESSTVIESSTIQTKLTNEVIIEKSQSVTDKVIKIQSNVYNTIVSNNAELIKFVVSKDTNNVIKKDVMLTDCPKNVPPIISQQSLDFAIDSLTDDKNAHTIQGIKNLNHNVIKKIDINTVNKKYNTEKTIDIDKMKDKIKNVLESATKSQPVKAEIKEAEIRKCGKKRRSAEIKDFKDNRKNVDNIEKRDIEVTIRLPNGEFVHMKQYPSHKPLTEVKQKLKDSIEIKNKATPENMVLSNAPNTHTFIPVINNIPFLTTSNLAVMSNNKTTNFNVVQGNKEAITNAVIENGILKLPTSMVNARPGLYPVNIVNTTNKIAIPAVPKVNTPNILDTIKMDIKKELKSISIGIRTKGERVQHTSKCEIFEKVYGTCNCGSDDIARTPSKNSGTIAKDFKAADLKESDSKKYIKSSDKNIAKEKAEGPKIIYDIDIDTNKVFIVDSNGPVKTPVITHRNVETSMNEKNVSTKSNNNTDTANEINAIEHDIKSTNKKIIGKKTSERISEGSNNESRVAAVRRYRYKQKLIREHLVKRNETLTCELEKVKQELATLKNLFFEHMRSCDKAIDIRGNYVGIQPTWTRT